MKKLGLLLSLSVTTLAFGESNQGDIYLAPATEGLNFFPSLIGGQPAKPEDFPATVYASMGGAACTANVIGPKVLIIAAHCVGNGRTASFKLLTGENHKGTCKHSPDYSRNSTADWALCTLEREVTGIAYEKINLDVNLPAKGEKVLLTGYGCRQPGGGGGNDGTLHTGEATVQSVPSGTNNDIVTKGGAALCFGDSGGPAYYVKSPTERVQISVNSRGDIRTTSYLSALATDQFKSFLTSWKSQTGLKICGVDEDVVGCRGVAPGPKDPELPAECKTTLDLVVKCLYGQPRREAIKQPDVCLKAVQDLVPCEEAAEKAGE